MALDLLPRVNLGAECLKIPNLIRIIEGHAGLTQQATPPWEAAARRGHGVPFVNGWSHCRSVSLSVGLTQG